VERETFAFFATTSIVTSVCDEFSLPKGDFFLALGVFVFVGTAFLGLACIKRFCAVSRCLQAKSFVLCNGLRN
jgi:hypothetical protein